MTTSNIPWNEGTWTTQPKSARSAGAGLVVEAMEGSDYWRRTLYGFEHDNGHALLAPFNSRYGSEVSFELAGLNALYDQAGLMVWAGPDEWIKAGVEINDGVPHIGAVVTRTPPTGRCHQYRTGATAPSPFVSARSMMRL